MNNIRVTQQTLELQLRAGALADANARPATPSDIFHDAVESASTFNNVVRDLVKSSWSKLNSLASAFRGGSSVPSRAMNNGVAEDSSGSENPEKLVASFDAAVSFLEEFFGVS
jgi:hypothetical protein